MGKLASRLPRWPLAQNSDFNFTTALPMSLHLAPGNHRRPTAHIGVVPTTASDPPDGHYPSVAFDLDTLPPCDGNITDPRVADYVTRLNSYTESPPAVPACGSSYAPSYPLKVARRPLECYDNARYVTLTGTPYGASPLPIADRQGEVDAIHAEIFAPREQPSSPAVVKASSNLDDAALLDKARWSRDAARFIALYDHGDWQGRGLPVAVGGRLVAGFRLAFWTGCDLTRMERLFLNSALSRHKSSRADYLERTLTKAINGCSQTYRRKID